MSWRSEWRCGSIYREWVVSVGKRDGLARVAHLLCEFGRRLEVAGLGKSEGFYLPMTQEHLADATGMSLVHINRVLTAVFGPRP
ncbi:helix-turn-helix domain-containing protein [Bosea sp. Root483D1]|uniref:helix-turn-helix domain-containing protein n=1 Tax=Bosea sp. Root483D1 TaxID=1736544 RepID=UPI0009E9A8A6